MWFVFATQGAWSVIWRSIRAQSALAACRLVASSDLHFVAAVLDRRGVGGQVHRELLEFGVVAKAVQE